MRCRSRSRDQKEIAGDQFTSDFLIVKRADSCDLHFMHSVLHRHHMNSPDEAEAKAAECAASWVLKLMECRRALFGKGRSKSGTATETTDNFLSKDTKTDDLHFMHSVLASLKETSKDPGERFRAMNNAMWMDDLMGLRQTLLVEPQPLGRARLQVLQSIAAFPCSTCC